jgi:uncharacterized protein (TIGR02147 family)
VLSNGEHLIRSAGTSGPGPCYIIGVNPAKPAPPQVTAYLDFRSYLKDWFRYRKGVQPGYSMRGFARNPALGISSTSFMTNLIKGARNLTQRQRLAFIKALKLEDAEAEYFDFLVQFNQAKTLDEKNYFFAHLSRYRGSRAKLLQEGQYAFFTEWHHSVIWNYIGLKGSEATPARIARHLAEELPPGKIQESLDLLLDMGLIKRTANGYDVSERHLVTDKSVLGQVAKDYHRAFLRLAAGALDRYSADRRQFKVLAFTVSDKGFAAVKQRIEAFLQEVNVLSLQLFPGARIP